MISPSRFLACVAGLSLASFPAPRSASSDDESPPARLASVLELEEAVFEKPGRAALAWMKFMAAGYRGSADHLGEGEAVDAELVLGEAIENAVGAFAPTLAGGKGKVRLNDAVEGPILSVAEDGIVATVDKQQVLVPWIAVDPGKLAFQMAKAKLSKEPELAAIATLRMLAGETGDAKKQVKKLTGELAAKLGELLEAWESEGAELAAARSLDAILREGDPAKAVEAFKSGWPAIAATSLGKEVAAQARAQYVLRGAEAYAGQTALARAVHGRTKLDPARAHPAAGPGGLGLEIEWEFESDAESADFDPGTLGPGTAGIVKNVGGSAKAAPFLVDQSRLVAAEVCGGEVPVEFGGDFELEILGGLSESAQGGSPGFLGVGLTTGDGKQFLLLQNFSALDVITDGKNGPSMEKKFDQLKRGDAFHVILRWTNGKLTFTRNGETFDPALNVKFDAPLRVFAIGARNCQWYVERLAIKGTATRDGLMKLGQTIAEREAQELFGA